MNRDKLFEFGFLDSKYIRHRQRDNGFGRLNLHPAKVKQGYEMQGIQLFVDKQFLKLFGLLIDGRYTLHNRLQESQSQISPFRLIMTPND